MPPCESTSSIHRRPKRSKAPIFAGSMTYSTTQVIMPQASDVRFPAESATGSGLSASTAEQPGEHRKHQFRECASSGTAQARLPAGTTGRRVLRGDRLGGL